MEASATEESFAARSEAGNFVTAAIRLGASAARTAGRWAVIGAMAVVYWTVMPIVVAWSIVVDGVLPFRSDDD